MIKSLPQPSTSVISRASFVTRFTPAQWMATTALASTDETVSYALFVLNGESSVDLADPVTVRSVNYLATVPAANPILTAAQAAAILDAGS